MHEDGLPRVGVLLVCKNEVKALAQTAPQLSTLKLSHPNLYELFLDGNSTDGSMELLRSLGLRAQSEGPGGLRGALDQAADHLISAGCEYILFAQPDGNCDLSAIPMLVDTCTRGAYDLVVASRYLGHAVSYDDNLVSKIGNRLFSLVASLLTGQYFTDVMVGFRMVSVRALESSKVTAPANYLRVERLFGTSLSWDPLMSVRGAFMGWKILELPVSEPPRLGGRMKRSSLRWGGAYMTQILYEGVGTRWSRCRFRQSQNEGAKHRSSNSLRT